MMWVVIEMDGGYSEDEMYVDKVFGPFASEIEARTWLKATKRRYSLSIHEVIPK